MQYKSRKRAGGRLVAAMACTVLGGATVPPAGASQLLAPSVGVADGAMGGATVATPLSPTAAAFSNPAGILSLEHGAVSAAIGVPVGHSRLHATNPDEYDTTSDFVAYAPEGGSVFDTGTSIRLGFAIYGSLGSAFDSDADPDLHVDHDFYSAQSISNVAFLAAMPVGSRLSIGASISLLYGQSHLRYFTSEQFAFTVRGAGVQAMFGARYQLSERVAVGVGARTPGMVWANGDDATTGGGHQNVDLDLDLPAQVFVGVNADVTDRFALGVAGRWTDASRFSNSIFRFEDTPQANIPFIRSASDEWRLCAGAGYRLTENVTVRGGVGYADSIVPDTWVSPLLIDSDEWKISGGLSWHVSQWTLDFTIGESPVGTRNISETEAAVLPGRYKMGGQIYMLGLRTTL